MTDVKSNTCLLSMDFKNLMARVPVLQAIYKLFVNRLIKV